MSSVNTPVSRTGDSFKRLHYLFKISLQLISRIVPEHCNALIVLNDLIKVSGIFFYFHIRLYENYKGI